MSDQFGHGGKQPRLGLLYEQEAVGPIGLIDGSAGFAGLQDAMPDREDRDKYLSAAALALWPLPLGSPTSGARMGPAPEPREDEHAAMMRGWWGLLRDTFSRWSGHKDARLGAALSYYSIFSLGPLIVIAIAIAGLVFGAEAVQAQIFGTLRGLLGESGTQAIDAMLKGANRPREGLIATIIGVGTLAFAAVGFMVQFKDAMNTVWEVETPPGAGIWRFARTYVLSLAGVLAVGFLLLVSMLVTAALSAAGKYIAPYLPEAAFQIMAFVASFAIIALLFAMMFKWLPDADIAWRDVLPGAILTAALFELGKFLIGLYIGKQGLESTYGAAASIVVVLIWVYYSAQLILMGAEFTAVYAQRYGSRRTQGSSRQGLASVASTDSRQGRVGILGE